MKSKNSGLFIVCWLVALIMMGILHYCLGFMMVMSKRMAEVERGRWSAHMMGGEFDK